MSNYSDLDKFKYDQLEAAAKKVTEANRDLIDEKFDSLDRELATLKTHDMYERGQLSKSRTAEDKVFEGWLRKGDRAPETKILQIGSDPSAGYLAPAGLAAEIYHSLVEANPLRGVARTYNTDRNSLEVLKKSASGSVVYRASDVSAIAETTGLSYSKLSFTPKEESYWLEISRVNLEDSAFPVEAEVAQEFGEAFGVFEANEQVNGTEGLIANVGTGALNTFPELHVGSTSVITAEKLVDLSLNIPVRYLANAKWMMNRATLAVVRQIKDAGTGTFLMSPLHDGPTALLCGHPIIINDFMPSISSALYPIAFGDFNKGFAIVDRTPSLRIDRLNEVRAQYGLVVFNGSMRTTHGPLDGAALTFLQMST